MWCNDDLMAVPGAGTDGTAGRYPSPITVAGAGRTTTTVTVQLGDVNHGFRPTSTCCWSARPARAWF